MASLLDTASGNVLITEHTGRQRWQVTTLFSTGSSHGRLVTAACTANHLVIVSVHILNLILWRFT